MKDHRIRNYLKPAMLGGILTALSACSYGVGTGYSSGYYSDGYGYNSGSSCDPYSPFDDYYACDSGYGFGNIGFGGGWYDNFYYPGSGYYIFDRGGRRYQMQNTHRRYWAHRRAEWGTRHGRRGDYRGRNNQNNDNRYRDRDQRDRNNDGVRGNRGENWQRDEIERRERRYNNGTLTPAQQAERDRRRQEWRNNNPDRRPDGARRPNRGDGENSGRWQGGRNNAETMPNRGQQTRPMRPGRPTGAQQQPQRERPPAMRSPSQAQPQVQSQAQRPTPQPRAERTSPRISPRSSNQERRNTRIE